MTFEIIQTGILQGLVLSIIAFGIMIPFRFLNFPDLTAEGAYPLGGAITACLITQGAPQVPSMLLSILGAGIMAIATAQVVLRLKVNSLLAGIILSTMVYSINLRMMAKPNIALFNFSGFSFGILSLISVILLCIASFFIFLKTDYGLKLRAVGLNPRFASKQGISLNKYTSLGLFIAGSMFGLAGSLIVQIQQFMDISIGVGIVIHGLASLMIGEAITGNHNLHRQLTAPIIGALIYQQVQGLALSFGLAPSDLKFFTGVVVLVILNLKENK